MLSFVALVASISAVGSASAGEWGGSEVSGFAARPGGGWYIAYPEGKVDTGGGAAHHGDMAGTPLNLPVTGAASTPTGNGYWLVASDGGIFSFGDAPFYGSTGAIALNRPIVGMAPTPSGNGYWMVATDGGIFSFGDARFFGSTGAIALNRPIVGMGATPSGNGYWMVASDGGIFSFGDARFFGSTGADLLPAPIVGMASSATGKGYWLVGSDGSVYAFGDANHFGEPVGKTYGEVIGIARRVGAAGYTIVDTGGHHTYGSGIGADGSHQPSGNTSPSAPFSAPAAIAADLMARANDERAARGLAPLQVSVSLSADAQELAQRMASSGVLEHLVDFSTLLPAHGATAGGENIAYTGAVDSAASIHLMWMNSSGHRVNMLNSGFDAVGVGVACRGGLAYASMLVLRTGGYAPLDADAPPAPVVRSDSSPTSPLHCG